ncbi:hypothetical protein POM88_047373 [Heracleum sosnowskyi]|uniref:Uncharacterized protein n=1 Tax=Heracleum sosnowskyi TaxID=360622 RepID=A0AAD8GTL8_9APIA|nr:hypothetical protein POM88_047373 [Heracleum sosnowskyi]
MDAAKMNDLLKDDETVNGLGGDLEKKMVLNHKDKDDKERIRKTIKSYEAAGYTLVKTEAPPLNPQEVLEWRNKVLEWRNRKMLEKKQEEESQVAYCPTGPISVMRDEDYVKKLSGAYRWKKTGGVFNYVLGVRSTLVRWASVVIRKSDELDAVCLNEIDCVQTMKGMGGTQQRVGDVSASFTNLLEKADDTNDTAVTPTSFFSLIGTGGMQNPTLFENECSNDYALIDVQSSGIV